MVVNVRTRDQRGGGDSGRACKAQEFGGLPPDAQQREGWVKGASRRTTLGLNERRRPFFPRTFTKEEFGTPTREPSFLAVTKRKIVWRTVEKYSLTVEELRFKVAIRGHK